MDKKRYQNAELNSAYERAKEIVRKYGAELIKASPAYNNRVPESLTAKLGVGMAVGLWAGIHATLKDKSPFIQTTPIHAIYQAGKEWGQHRDLSTVN